MNIDEDRRDATGTGGGSEGHAAHDAELIARFVGGDATGRDEARARDLVASCPECAVLAADLVAIARATADLPEVPRHRDFRITPQQAAELHPAGFPSRLRRVLSGGSDRPFVPWQRLAGATAAIGIVMALVTSPVGLAALSPGHATLSAPGAAPALTSQGGTVGGAPEHVSGAGASPAAAAAARAAASSAPATVSVGSSGPTPSGVPAASPAGPLAQAPVAGSATSGPVAAATEGPGASMGVAGAGSTGTAPDTSGTSAGPSAGAVGPASAGAPEGGQFGSSIARARGPGSPFGPWEAWLVVAAAGGVGFLALHLAARRAA